jgi:hypothetical protein
VLYAWREAKHFNNELPSQKPAINTDAYMEAFEAAEAKKMHEKQTNPDYELFEAFENDLNGYGDENGW